jgi:hypothetical protein
LPGGSPILGVEELVAGYVDSLRVVWVDCESEERRIGAGGAQIESRPADAAIGALEKVVNTLGNGIESSGSRWIDGEGEDREVDQPTAAACPVSREIDASEDAAQRSDAGRSSIERPLERGIDEEGIDLGGLEALVGTRPVGPLIEAAE